MRIGNAVEARWERFDLESKLAILEIPRAEMKVGKGRIQLRKVILPSQLTRDLRQWRAALPTDTVWLFPGNQGRDHLSREAIEKALRETLGLAGRHFPHGWRSALSTRAREDTDFDGELIAAQCA